MMLGQRGIALLASLASAILIAAFGCEAFNTVAAPQRVLVVTARDSSSRSAASYYQHRSPRWTKLLWAAQQQDPSGGGGEAADEGPDPTAGAAVDNTEEDTAEAPVEEQQQQEEEEEEEEDPELKALKEEIGQLEEELKKARRKVADVSDRADDFTKTGYARKVAEMENMRRARSVRFCLFVLDWFA